MKRWVFLSSLMVALASLAMFSPLSAFSQEGAAPKSKIFVFSQDFPPDIFFEHPQPPVKETRFWQLLDKNMREHSSMELTENLEDANYRVTLECSGVAWCGKIKVYLMTPHRDVLASYSIPGRPLFFPPNLGLVAKRLTETLDYRIASIEQGGVGNYGLTRYRYRFTGGPRTKASNGPSSQGVSSNAGTQSQRINP
jgi:hypothetical protein